MSSCSNFDPYKSAVGRVAGVSGRNIWRESEREREIRKRERERCVRTLAHYKHYMTLYYTHTHQYNCKARLG